MLATTDPDHKGHALYSRRASDEGAERVEIYAGELVKSAVLASVELFGVALLKGLFGRLDHRLLRLAGE